MESDLVTADMVEASEFPHLAMRHAVMGVPKTIVNDRSAADGMLPEDAFLEVILASARRAGS
jgi:hypothetical protein